MITTDRRSFLAGTAGLAFVAALPRAALSEMHDTLKIAIAAETGDLDLLQNISTLSAYTIVFDALIHYGQNGALEPGLATKWNIADDQLSIVFDLREGVAPCLRDGADLGERRDQVLGDVDGQRLER